MTQKSCGSCGVCCRVMRVDAFEKPARRNCRYLRVLKPKSPNKCQNYANRPDECREFACLWLVNDLGRQFRPDRSGILMVAYELPEPVGTCVQVLEAEKGAYQRNLDRLDTIMVETKWPTGAIILREDHEGRKFLVGGPAARVGGYREYRTHMQFQAQRQSGKSELGSRVLEQITVDVDPQHIRWSGL